jgi:hypothetical protein
MTNFASYDAIRRNHAQSGVLTCEIVETRPKSASCAAVCGTVSLNRRRA